MAYILCHMKLNGSTFLFHITPSSEKAKIVKHVLSSFSPKITNSFVPLLAVQIICKIKLRQNTSYYFLQPKPKPILG